MQFNALAANT